MTKLQFIKKYAAAGTIPIDDDFDWDNFSWKKKDSNNFNTKAWNLADEYNLITKEKSKSFKRGLGIGAGSTAALGLGAAYLLSKSKKKKKQQELVTDEKQKNTPADSIFDFQIEPEKENKKMASLMDSNTKLDKKLEKEFEKTAGITTVFRPTFWKNLKKLKTIRGAADVTKATVKRKKADKLLKVMQERLKQDPADEEALKYLNAYKKRFRPEPPEPPRAPETPEVPQQPQQKNNYSHRIAAGLGAAAGFAGGTFLHSQYRKKIDEEARRRAQSQNPGIQVYHL